MGLFILFCKIFLFFSWPGPRFQSNRLGGPGRWEEDSRNITIDYSIILYKNSLQLTIFILVMVIIPITFQGKMNKAQAGIEL